MPITEKDLSVSSGLSRDVFRKMRSSGVLIEGVHWSKELHGIEYNGAGLQEIEKLLNEPVKEPSKVMVVISRMLRGNDRRMIAIHDGVKVVVQARSTHNFMPGIEIEVVCGDGSLYYYHGRLPRRKGKL